MTADQIALFSEPMTTTAATTNGHKDDLLDALREFVREDDMTEDELDAAVADALEQLARRPIAPTCRCTRALVFAPDTTCHWCGREVAQ